MATEHSFPAPKGPRESRESKDHRAPREAKASKAHRVYKDPASTKKN